MSIVTYNGITLPYPMTHQFLMEPVYDDQGGVDQILDKYTVTVRCHINTSLVEQIDSTIPVNTPASDIIKIIRTKLRQPRRKLSFQVNGIEMIPIQASDTVDARNGPAPQRVSFVGVTVNTYILDFTIIGHYQQRGELTEDEVIRYPTLYNRWSETVTIDSTGASVISRNGKFMVRSDSNSQVTPDFMREYMAGIGLPTGFVRQVHEYTVTPDGLGLQYRIEDKEVYKTPPHPAYDAQGTYTETFSNMASIRKGVVELTLRGKKSHEAEFSQEKLLEAALLVAHKKIILRNSRGEAQPNTNEGHLEEVAIQINMYDNEVKVMMRAYLSQLTTGIQSMGNFLSENLNTLTHTPHSEKADQYPDGDPVPDEPDQTGTGLGWTPTPQPRGSAGLVLQAAAYHDKNIRAFIDPATRQIRTGVMPGEGKGVNT